MRSFLFFSAVGLILLSAWSCANNSSNPANPGNGGNPPTATPTLTPTGTPTMTTTSSFTPSPTGTFSLTSTNSSTPTGTPTATNSLSPTSTDTPVTILVTATYTWTGTSTNTGTPTNTGTSTFTPTATPPFVVLSSWGGNGVGAGQFRVVTNLYFDYETSLLWASDFSANRIQAFDVNGGYVEAVGNTGNAGSGTGQFSGPGGIGFYNDGVHSRYLMYVADSNNNRIEEFAAPCPPCTSFSYFDQWGTSGSGNGNFAGPTAITGEGTGNGYYYVADWGNNLIQEFYYDKTFLRQWSGAVSYTLSSPNDVAVDLNSDDVVVADSGNNRLVEFDANGNFIRKWGKNGGDGTAGTGNGEFNNPQGLDIDNVTGNIYVADTGNNRIQRFDSSGNFISKIGSLGAGTGQFNTPLDVTILDNSTVIMYVADKGNFRIVKIQVQ